MWCALTAALFILGPAAATAPPPYPELPPLSEAQVRHLRFLSEVLETGPIERHRADAAAGLLGLGRPEATEVLVRVLTSEESGLEAKMAVVSAIGSHVGPPPRLLEPTIDVLLSLGEGNGKLEALRAAVRQFGPAGLERIREIVVDPNRLMTARMNAVEILAVKPRPEELRILGALADAELPIDGKLRVQIIDALKQRRIDPGEGSWATAVTQFLADSKRTEGALEAEVKGLEERIKDLNKVIEVLLEQHYLALDTLDTTRVFNRLDKDLASKVPVVRTQALKRSDILIRDGILLPDPVLDALRARVSDPKEIATNRIAAAQLLDQLDDAQVGQLAAGLISVDMPTAEVLPYVQIVAAHPTAEGYVALRTLLQKLPERQPLDAKLAAATARALWGVASAGDAETEAPLDLIPDAERTPLLQALLRVEPAKGDPVFDRIIAFLAPEADPAFAARAGLLVRGDDSALAQANAPRRRAVAEAFVARGALEALRPYVGDPDVYPIFVEGFAEQSTVPADLVTLVRMRPSDEAMMSPWRRALETCARGLEHDERVAADRDLEGIEGIDAELRADLLIVDLARADVPPLLAGAVLPHLWASGQVTDARDIIAAQPADAEIKDFAQWRLRFALRAQDFNATEAVNATPEQWGAVAKALVDTDPKAAAALIEAIKAKPDLPEGLVTELDALLTKMASGEPTG